MAFAKCRSTQAITVDLLRSSFSCFLSLEQRSHRTLLFFICILDKSSWQQLPCILQGGRWTAPRNLFLVQLPALCHASKKVFRMNKYSGQIQALFVMVISKEAVVSFQELRSPLCALENTNFSLSLISILPLMAQNGRHPKARGHVSQGGLSSTLQSQLPVASLWPLPTPHFLGPGTPMKEQRARKR